jgi:crossover junction endodeoxyribonuclease RusA
MNTITLTLPYPISANRYWRPVPIGKHITIVPTKEAKQYRKDVAALCIAAGVTLITGRVKVDILLYPHRPLDWKTRQRKLGASWDDTVQCIDLDNARKVLYDSLKGVAMEDDKWVREETGKRMEPDALPARVVVTVTAIATAQPQMGLL